MKEKLLQLKFDISIKPRITTYRTQISEFRINNSLTGEQKIILMHQSFRVKELKVLMLTPDWSVRMSSNYIYILQVKGQCTVLILLYVEIIGFFFFLQDTRNFLCITIYTLKIFDVHLRISMIH